MDPQTKKTSPYKTTCSLQLPATALSNHDLRLHSWYFLGVTCWCCLLLRSWAQVSSFPALTLTLDSTLQFFGALFISVAWASIEWWMHCNGKTKSISSLRKSLNLHIAFPHFWLQNVIFRLLFCCQKCSGLFSLTVFSFAYGLKNFLVWFPRITFLLCGFFDQHFFNSYTVKPGFKGFKIPKEKE